MREQKNIINIPYPVTVIFRQHKPSGHKMMFGGLPCFRLCRLPAVIKEESRTRGSGRKASLSLSLMFVVLLLNESLHYVAT